MARRRGWSKPLANLGSIRGHFGGAAILAAWTDWLRHARWLDRARVSGYTKILALAYLPLLAIPWAYATGLADGHHAPVDFMSFWSAGRLAWIDPTAAYDAGRASAFQAQVFDAPGRYLPFLYPPPFLALAALLGLAPFALAYPSWVAATWGLYAVAARRLVPGGAWAVVVFPALYINAVQGQTAALFTALFLAAFAQLDRRPVVAGLLLGALSFKPQLGLLIPIALAAGGHWRAFVGAATCALALLGGSMLLFGPEIIPAFLQAGHATAAQFEAGALPWAKFQSLFGALRQLGAPTAVAGACQAALALGAAAIVVWAWRSRAEASGKVAVLAAAALTATPYLLDYDLTLSIAPIAWLAARGMSQGLAPWEKAFLLLAYASPALCRPFALSLGFNLEPLIGVALLALVAARLRGATG